MKCDVVPIRLKLKRDFVVAGGRESLKRNVIIVIDGIGIGEASGSIHYGSTADEIERDLIVVAERMRGLSEEDVPAYLAAARNTICPPALCAVSTAWHDRRAKQLAQPLFKYLKLERPRGVSTSVTVSIGDLDALHNHLQAGYDHIKIKMDADDIANEHIIIGINRSRNTVFRIDANGSWTYEKAVDILSKIAIDTIELIEQPFPANAVDDWKRLRENNAIPLFMDETISSADHVKRVAEYVDGVNIKIQKSGLLETAIEAMKAARALDLKVMLGCMIESSVGIATAYHLSSAADYLDLDGRLLIEDDPFSGLIYDHGKLNISSEIGHGISFA